MNSQFAGLTREELPLLAALGVDRVVSGSALFRDDRLVENIRDWSTTFAGRYSEGNSGRIRRVLRHNPALNGRDYACLAASAALTITAKASAFREAPPTSAPSMSG